MHHGTRTRRRRSPEKIATLVGRVLRSESRDTLFKIIQNTELSILKSASNPEPVSGSTITYTLTVTNHSPRAAE